MVLTMAAGMLMMAVAIAIGGFALELILYVLSRALIQTHSEPMIERPVIIHLDTSDSATGVLQWADNTAA